MVYSLEAGGVYHFEVLINLEKWPTSSFAINVGDPMYNDVVQHNRTGGGGGRGGKRGGGRGGRGGGGGEEEEGGEGREEGREEKDVGGEEGEEEGLLHIYAAVYTCTLTGHGSLSSQPAGPQSSVHTSSAKVGSPHPACCHRNASLQNGPMHLQHWNATNQIISAGSSIKYTKLFP